jgi:hypothetical protein
LHKESQLDDTIRPISFTVLNGAAAAP